MEIVIDLSHVIDFFYLPTSVMAGKIFLWFGIPIFLMMASKSYYRLWVLWRQDVWKATHKFVLLAIDIPRTNEQTPKAVENFFSHLSGMHDPLDLIERYWEGKFFIPISLEIISIEGYIQFLIHTPDKFRNLVESAVYSQYPDAEITEVDDYTQGVPRKFPDDEYDVYGSEFMHAENQVFPIKTYKEFEHIIADAEVQYKDSIATLMDLFNSIGPGEQMWYQILLVPEAFEWPKLGEKEIKKILREDTGDSDKHFGDKSVDSAMGVLDFISTLFYKLLGGEKVESDDDKEGPLKMLDLNPIEKEKVEAIAEKTAKLGFKAKIRYIYFGKNDNFYKHKAIGGIIGYMKQFIRMHLNGLKPDTQITMTRNSHLFFFKKLRLNWKKRDIVRNYVVRSAVRGRDLTILNIEELATLWHFPSSVSIKAPLLQKVLAKKSEPPATLPTMSELTEYPDKAVDDQIFQEIEDSDNVEKTASGPPKNLPI